MREKDGSPLPRTSPSNVAILRRQATAARGQTPGRKLTAGFNTPSWRYRCRRLNQATRVGRLVTSLSPPSSNHSNLTSAVLRCSSSRCTALRHQRLPLARGLASAVAGHTSGNAASPAASRASASAGLHRRGRASASAGVHSRRLPLRAPYARRIRSSPLRPPSPAGSGRGGAGSAASMPGGVAAATS
ncbi:hypothetical protein OsI_23039 [Oryza sativa Indica Group]|uniref:Uncharacterized protein n=1 Tax=Oryza sativa subsp. indica TaxID=39946 RepID=B8B2V8_ORYSI|nr:hypothetical protein OsI_23039 [Oryza sativa Indica Group]